MGLPFRASAASDGLHDRRHQREASHAPPCQLELTAPAPQAGTDKKGGGDGLEGHVDSMTRLPIKPRRGDISLYVVAAVLFLTLILVVVWP